MQRRTPMTMRTSSSNVQSSTRCCSSSSWSTSIPSWRSNTARKFSGYFDDPQRMESMRVEYYNCINAIEFQSEVLSQLVEELLGLRGALRRGEALEMSKKDLSIRLANLKLDISDRKTKRFFKEKERRQLVETLSPAIAEAKTQRLLAEQAGSAVESTPMDAAPQSAHMEATASDCGKHPSSGTRQRRYKHYSDKELASLLREKVPTVHAHYCVSAIEVSLRDLWSVRRLAAQLASSAGTVPFNFTQSLFSKPRFAQFIGEYKHATPFLRARTQSVTLLDRRNLTYMRDEGAQKRRRQAVCHIQERKFARDDANRCHKCASLRTRALRKRFVLIRRKVATPGQAWLQVDEGISDAGDPRLSTGAPRADNASSWFTGLRGCHTSANSALRFWRGVCTSTKDRPDAGPRHASGFAASAGRNHSSPTVRGDGGKVVGMATVADISNCLVPSGGRLAACFENCQGTTGQCLGTVSMIQVQVRSMKPEILGSAVCVRVAVTVVTGFLETTHNTISVAQLDRALPPSLPRPWLKETGGATCDADQEAYEVACMELAAFLAWLIAQARARRAMEVLADMKSRRGLLAEVATSWMRLPDDTKMEWIPSDHHAFLADVLTSSPLQKESWVPKRRLRRKTCAQALQGRALLPLSSAERDPFVPKIKSSNP
ncbi:unnamed protein product [Symbiodinium sp. CCMP2592]|nr:unnamed protein product [Symbiodinium sp. CCMP2592]